VGGVRGCCPEGVRGAAGGVRGRQPCVRLRAGQAGTIEVRAAAGARGRQPCVRLRAGQAGTIEVRAAASARDAGSGSI